MRNIQHQNKGQTGDENIVQTLLLLQCLSPKPELSWAFCSKWTSPSSVSTIDVEKSAVQINMKNRTQDHCAETHSEQWQWSRKQYDDVVNNTYRDAMYDIVHYRQNIYVLNIYNSTAWGSKNQTRGLFSLYRNSCTTPAYKQETVCVDAQRCSRVNTLMLLHVKTHRTRPSLIIFLYLHVFNPLIIIPDAPKVWIYIHNLIVLYTLLCTCYIYLYTLFIFQKVTNKKSYRRVVGCSQLF